MPINEIDIEPLPSGQIGITLEVMQVGPQGPTGPANSLSIGSVTSGETPSATITGSAPAQTLNLVLPKGDQGEAGPVGPQGEVGPAGSTFLSGLEDVSIDETPEDTAILSYDSSTDSWKPTYTATEPYILGSRQVVTTNPNGIVSFGKLRLYNQPEFEIARYTQINPCPNNENDISFSFPDSSGVIATNNTALMLTGEQIALGAKTFSGQIELTGQAATNGTSAITRNLGDARYLQTLKSYSTQRFIGSANSTTLTQVASLPLPFGVYYIEAAAATFTPTGTPANTTIRFTTELAGAGEFTGSDDYGSGSLTHVDVEADPMSTTFIRQSVGTASTFFRNIRGILTISTSTTVKLEFRQSIASANIITCRAGAYIIARKIS